MPFAKEVKAHGFIKLRDKTIEIECSQLFSASYACDICAYIRKHRKSKHLYQLPLLSIHTS